MNDKLYKKIMAQSKEKFDPLFAALDSNDTSYRYRAQALERERIEYTNGLLHRENDRQLLIVASVVGAILLAVYLLQLIIK